MEHRKGVVVVVVVRHLLWRSGTKLGAADQGGREEGDIDILLLFLWKKKDWFFAPKQVV